MQHLSSVLGKQSEQVLQERLGMGLSQYRILMVLEWSPRVSQKVIADSLGQTEAAVSRQVKAMVAKGMVVAKPAPGNRRRYVIAPTPFGMKLTETANDALRRSMGSDISGFGEEELAQLSASLHKLHRAVCRPGKTGACDHQLGL
jgi:DNA-binding MarR family transcriptional regulator